MNMIANKTVSEIHELFTFFYNTDIKSAVGYDNYKIDNIPYIKYIFCLSMLTLSSYLCDGVFTHWKNIFCKSNKYNTKKYLKSI